MSPVDLNKNRDSILKAHADVFNLTSSTNWVLYGYEGRSDILEIVSKGDGGIPEFIEELNSGRLLYGYLKVIDTNSNLPKFVFIHWQGQGVPEQRKGSCASHVRDIANLLRGAHITINARTEEDVDEDYIIKEIAKSSGANYGFHKEVKKELPAPGPVGSVYEKVKPQIEIKPNIRDKFWQEAAKDEENRKISEVKRKQIEREKYEKELKEKEMESSKKREVLENERLKKNCEIKAAEKQANTPAKVDTSHWNKEDSAEKDKEERGKRSEEMRKNRNQEAQMLISNSTSQARSKFEQRTSQFDKPADANPPPTRKLKDTFTSEITSSSEKLPIGTKKKMPDVPSAAHSTTNQNYLLSEAIKSPQPVLQTEDLYEDVAMPLKVHTEPNTRDSDYIEMEKQVRNMDFKSQEENLPESIHEDNLIVPQSPLEETDLRAIALYDYEAAEDNEITFDPEDIITDVEKIDEGWWIGTNKEGKRGMFPANYVQLIE